MEKYIIAVYEFVGYYADVSKDDYSSRLEDSPRGLEQAWRSSGSNRVDLV